MPSAAPIELGPGEGPIPLLLGQLRGDVISDALEDVGQVPTSGAHAAEP